MYNVAVTSTYAKGNAVDCTTGELTIVNPLKVTWLGFDAKVINGQAHLSWQTASETNNSHFEIEKAGIDLAFKTIGIVKGMGNTTTITHYSFVDESPLFEHTYFRLKDVDFNGQTSYSKVKYLNSKIASAQKFSIYPNPNNGIFTIKGSNLELNTHLQFVLRDVQGRVLVSENIQNLQKDFSLSKNLSWLSKGLYLIQLIQDNKTEHFNIIID